MNQIGLNEINWIKLDQTGSNQITPDQIDFMRFNVPTYVVTVPTVYMFFFLKISNNLLLRIWIKITSPKNYLCTMQSRFSDIKFSDKCDLVTIFQRPFLNLLHKNNIPYVRHHNPLSI